jgi:hypothetical protein
MSSLTNRKPLCIGKKTQYYRKLYSENHSEFCRRFIDTVILHHFEKFITLSVANNVDSVGIDYKIKDTDAFLWMIRSLLDNFMQYKTVKDAVFDPTVSKGIDQIFTEIKSEYRFIQNLFINSSKKNQI